MYGACVNTEISVGESFCNGVTDFTQGGNILGILNLFCGFIIANIVVVIYFHESQSKERAFK